MDETKRRMPLARTLFRVFAVAGCLIVLWPAVRSGNVLSFYAEKPAMLLWVAGPSLLLGIVVYAWFGLSRSRQLFARLVFRAVCCGILTPVVCVLLAFHLQSLLSGFQKGYHEGYHDSYRAAEFMAFELLVVCLMWHALYRDFAWWRRHRQRSG
ncbi:MAG TPA: hypothetical protein VM492_15005 [Sumerlaeia bacterium]|nr:hypothetical protein [Sumerlaeia bacterium]